MRTRFSLSGTWDFVADLDPKYHAIYGGFEKPEADRRHWRKVPVPGVWQKYGERYAIYEGVCWFAREFDAEELQEGSKALLRFGAVNYLCNVYLNGEQVGSHEGGYTEFVLDISDTLKVGANHLAVQVDNRAVVTKWPPVLGYFNYGGIHRDVSLEILTGPTLDEIALEAVRQEPGWELVVKGSALNARAGLAVRVIDSGEVLLEAPVPPNGSFCLRVPCPDASSWTPENPYLEAIQVVLTDGVKTVFDRKEIDFGFRAIAVRDCKIRLNGQAYPLKGVCHVYDSEVTGLVMTPAQIETDLLLMKEAGCNSVRCHYPMDEKFYSACDRLGLMVWIEPPVYCYHPSDDAKGTSFADPEWLALIQKTATEMISVARNHSSVIIYSIGNECNTANAEAESFFRALAATIRQADSTRLISYAALYGIVGPIADIVDVLGINSYWGWYDKIFGGKGLAPEAAQGLEPTAKIEPIDLTPMRKMLEKVIEQKQDIALLLTEFGADSVSGNYSACNDLWSENYHASLIREILKLAEEYPQIIGTFPFCFADYRDPSKIPNGYWNEMNLKGLVDYRRNRKLAFQAVKESYR